MQIISQTVAVATFKLNKNVLEKTLTYSDTVPPSFYNIQHKLTLLDLFRSIQTMFIQNLLW